LATQRVAPFEPAVKCTIELIASFSRLRVLAWQDDVLYASHGYKVLRAKISRHQDRIDWQPVAEFHPARWRRVTSTFELSARLCRDGFHALAVAPSGTLVGAVPHAIVTRMPGSGEFRVSFRVLRGTRPLHFAVTPRGQIFWGEYFDNRQRDEVYIYSSLDDGEHWDVAYTFPQRAIRHVHNIVYDKWEDCLWVLTGDEGHECRILRASCDFKSVDVVLSGHQQARTASAVIAHDAIYFSSDTPFEMNHVYRLDRQANLRAMTQLNSSSISGASVGDAIFFSTMVEPSSVNHSREVCLYGSASGNQWESLVGWRKDRWPMSLFQYGNALMPDGNNTSGCLALTTVAVEGADFQTFIWRVT